MAEMCTQCGADAHADASYCHRCGVPLTDETPQPTPRQLFASAVERNSEQRDAETILWQGQYSWRAMIGTWIAAGIATVCAPLVALTTGLSGQGWLAMAGLLTALWLGLGVTLLYRQIGVHYYLTNQRLLHERGLLWRDIDRIEAIDIDDVSFKQGPVERALGVGTLSIRSSDISTPQFDLIGIENVRDVASLVDGARRKERLRRGLHIETV